MASFPNLARPPSNVPQSAWACSGGWEKKGSGPTTSHLEPWSAPALNPAPPYIVSQQDVSGAEAPALVSHGGRRLILVRRHERRAAGTVSP